MSECRRIPIEELDGQTRPSVCEFASSPRMVSALAELLKAYKYAGSTTCCRWEFAVEISRLRDAGISESDFRWLVRRGYVEHAREVTRLGEDGRRFRPTGDLSFAKRTCFILTATGAGIADELVQGPLLGNSEQASDIASNHVYSSGSSSKPTWDFEKRTLYFRNQIVKRFKWHAANQEIVLSTFQEENWPVRIDDPIPPTVEQDSKRRLSDTIKCLNRKQANELIHFHGDGTGEGVTWEKVTRYRTNGH